jgi:hypothetical protein
VDEEHANLEAAWRRMGRPHYVGRDQVEQLERAAAVRAERLAVVRSGEEQVVEFTLPPWGVARVTLLLAGS